MLFVKRPEDLTAEEAAAALAEGNLMLVHDEQVRAEGYVTGSLHIPFNELPGRLAELPSGRPVAFVVLSGVRNSRGARFAAKQGAQAQNVRGGMLAWQMAGLAIEHDVQLERRGVGQGA